MRTDDRADFAVPTDEYPTLDSKILVRNSMEWSKDVEMGSVPLSGQHAFHFRCLLSWMILMLSAERLVALGFCLISCKLADSACWLEGMVCSLKDVEGGFC